MEKRIELEKRARKANQITELNLDNCRSTSIVGLTDEYTALESLSLINVGLTTLKGFPKLPNLKKLELSDNRISNGLNYLTTSPKLQYLNLSGNKIKDLETLKPLEEFKHLAVLDLFNNEATQIENYREKIFEMLPSLKFLDGFDANDVEAPSEGDDEDEVNGNDSDDDDKQNIFCLNGLEIDLDELAAFEQRVLAKKKSNASIATSAAADEADDLDELLKAIKLKEDSANSGAHSNAAGSTCASSSDGSVVLHTENTNAISPNENANRNNGSHPPVNFAIFLYWFLAILNLASAAYYPECGSEEDCSSDELCDDSDVSLSEVYNEDIDGSSEWDENACEDADDTDEIDSDGDLNESGTAKADEGEPAAEAEADADNKDADEAAEEEPQARGKKRKHDG